MTAIQVMASCVLILAAASGRAQERQLAAAEQLGAVHFATSCTEPAQEGMDVAVALLHSFQFSRAVEGFNAVLKRDPACAIAYWGIALSEWGNPFAPGLKDNAQLQLGRQSAASGTALRAKSERERAYIAAVGKLYEDSATIPQPGRLARYRDAMRVLAAANPQDDEAQIFYALALAAAEDPQDKSYADLLKAGAILENLFERQPDHPGLAHYIIHAYDVPALAARALTAARRYAQIAPDAPHALHMPSHTFTRLGYWQDSIASNTAAAAAARREGQTAEELHASDYQTYAYLQTAQDAAAAGLVDSLPQIKVRFDPRAALSGAGPPAAGYFALAAIPARYALERKDWQQAEQLAVHQTPFPYTEALSWFARGLGAARLGHAAAATKAAGSLQKIHQRLMAAHEPYWAQQVQIQHLAISAWALMAAGDAPAALPRMRAAADLEDRTEKSAMTPGPLAPARELLGEMLLLVDEPAQALQQFEATLTREPRRFGALYGAAHAAQLSGNPETSEKYFRQLLQVCENADRPGRSELQEAQRALPRD
ncbi:MAG TPA: hypothetical protein VGI91_08405 [Steroidobacteraceae bacterium]|jgi:hypothetical protein